MGVSLRWLSTIGCCFVRAEFLISRYRLRSEQVDAPLSSPLICRVFVRLIAG